MTEPDSWTQAISHNPSSESQVQQFVGRDAEQLADRMGRFFSVSDVEQYFVEKYRGRTAEEKGSCATTIQACIRGWVARRAVKHITHKSLLKPTPDKAKVEAIVRALTIEDDSITVEEAKLLFSELLNISLTVHTVYTLIIY